MEIWLLVLVSLMAVLIVFLLVKIYLLKKSAKEIVTAFRDRLMTDTNTLIDISGSDRQMKRLANNINTELRVLRAQRQRYLQGDLELRLSGFAGAGGNISRGRPLY